ncbi:hypothetical protein STEG23_012060, partial [Scotinomys teguina]
MGLCVFAQACEQLQGSEEGIESPRVGVPDVVMSDVSTPRAPLPSLSSRIGRSVRTCRQDLTPQDLCLTVWKAYKNVMNLYLKVPYLKFHILPPPPSKARSPMGSHHSPPNSVGASQSLSQTAYVLKEADASLASTGTFWTFDGDCTSQVTKSKLLILQAEMLTVVELGFQRRSTSGSFLPSDPKFQSNWSPLHHLLLCITCKRTNMQSNGGEMPMMSSLSPSVKTTGCTISKQRTVIISRSTPKDKINRVSHSVKLNSLSELATQCAFPVMGLQ